MLMLFCFENVLADGEAQISAAADNKTGIVTISGTSDKNSIAGIYVLNPGIESLDKMTPENAGEFINYAKQVYTNSDGSFSFSYKLLKNGEYKVYLSNASGTKKAYASFIYVSQEAIDGYIAEIEKNRDAENKKGDLKERAQNISEILGSEYVLNIFDIYEKDFPENIKISNISSEIYENIASYNTECKDKEDVKNMFFSSVYAYILNHETAGKFAPVFEKCTAFVNLDEKVYAYYKESGEAAAEIDALLEKCEIHNASDINNSLIESVFMYGFKKMKNYSEFMPFVTKLGNAAGLDLEEYSKIKAPHIPENVDKAMLEKRDSLTSIEEVRKEFSAQIELENAREIGGGNESVSGGSSRGGSSGGKTIGSSVAIGGETKSNAEDVFDDLNSAPWAKEYILKLYDKKIISGYGDKTFRPNNGVLREEAVKIIVSALNLLDKNASSPFDDVDENMWYAPYIGSAYRLKIVSGTDEKTFGTGNNISRQDMAVIIDNILKVCGISAQSTREYEGFNDEDMIAPYAKEAVKNLYCAKILSGDNFGSFNPKDNLTRAETAAVMSKVLDITGGV